MASDGTAPKLLLTIASVLKTAELANPNSERFRCHQICFFATKHLIWRTSPGCFLLPVRVPVFRACWDHAVLSAAAMCGASTASCAAHCHGFGSSSSSLSSAGPQGSVPPHAHSRTQHRRWGELCLMRAFLNTLICTTSYHDRGLSSWSHFYCNKQHK